MQNWFGTVVLLAWPLVVLWLYRTRPVGQATVWAIWGGQLMLPTNAAIKFAGIPAVDKNMVANLTALICCAFVDRNRRRPRSGVGLAELCVLMFLAGPFITSELNSDPIRVGDGVLQGLDHYEAVSVAFAQFIFLIPFFLGRRLLRSTADTAETLRILVIGGLIYSVLMLIEIRIGPQLNYRLYGFSNSFALEIRNGGYRAVVFMQNGLVTAFFLMTTAVAAAVFWRTQKRITPASPGGVMGYLMTVLFLTKSLGAFTYGAALVPLVRWASPRLQLRIAMVLAAIALSYPLLRTADLVPTDLMVSIARSVDQDRADSLGYRFIQERQLLEHASERLLFGWGRFGRNLVYLEGTDLDISVTDGLWTIILGQFGLFGFVAEFGLLAFTVFRAASAVRFADPESDGIYLAGLGLIVAISMIDLLPNASLTSWTWLLAGALLGRAEQLRAASRSRTPAYPPEIGVRPIERRRIL
jgi:hypothetical protein